MSFLESPTFPGCPSYGYMSSPGYLVSVVRMQSGVERRNRLWSRPLLKFQVTIGPQVINKVQEVLEFFHAVGGRECGFRFKDWSDYKSCRVNQTAAVTDQPIVPGTSSPGGYQLVKDYVVGSRSQRREITKPVVGRIRVANQAGVEQLSSTWSMDEQTGIITALGGFSGTPSFWGGEFDVPVRFDDEFLPIRIEQYNVQEVSFTLTEIRIHL